MSRVRWPLALVLAAIAATIAAQNTPLTVVNTGPEGPLDQLAQANEIRIVFSEPMVVLGRIPARVTAPFVRITPSIQGTFRWSGTTVLIFTPDPKKPLPYATTYQVTVDATATAVSGRTLERPVMFSFITPTVRLLQTNWYRRNGTVNSPLVVTLRFNQPVKAQDVAAHLSASLERHDWDAPPPFTAEEERRLRALDPGAPAAWARKVDATRRVAAGGGAVGLKLTSNWDKKRFPASPDLVAFETTTAVLPESWVKLVLAGSLPSPAGKVTPGQPQSFTVKAERAFFIDDFHCSVECDADAWNPVRLTVPVAASAFASAVRASDITSGEQPVPKADSPRQRREFAPDSSVRLTLEDAGFAAQAPDRTYAVSAASTLTSADGQTLGYTWLGIVENWHMRAFTSFGDGHGVWETGGGTQLPFYARNLRTVTQWAIPLSLNDLMPRILELRKGNFLTAPPGAGTTRTLNVTADRVQSHGLDLKSALQPAGTGLVWTAVREGTLLPRTRQFGEDDAARTRSALVQVTNLGISVKDSPQNTLILVTRLDTGAPVNGARVSIVRTDNTTFWRGTTGADGVAIAPDTRLRPGERWWEFSFIVTAEKDGDIAYVGSDWNEGVLPWDFGVNSSLAERDPLLRGSVFADRGVYRLGEEVHLKAILRQNTANGIRLLQANTPIVVTVRDVQNRLVDERVVRVGAWSSAEWTLKLPPDGTLGNYSVRAILESDRPAAKAPEDRRPGETPSPRSDEYVPYTKAVNGSFLVAAYRRPDFRVDVSLRGNNLVAGEPLKGVVSARYLFGSSLGARPVTWRYSKSAGWSAPDTITEKFGSDRWIFVGGAFDNEHPPESGEIRGDETTLQRSGDLPLTLETKRDAGVPYVYSLEGDVEDVSRQHIANRASVTVHPAPWYIGVRRPSYFIEQKAGLKTEVIAARLDGMLASGVAVDVKLTQIQWTSVRRAEGNGFYTWDTERREVPAGTWSLKTADTPVPLDIPLKNGGYFVLEARSRSDGGRYAVTRTSFYVLGDGYTAWARFDHNRIELVPERKTYRPGETARIMIQSPWEQATALVTMEREGIRSHRQFTLTSTQQSVSLPITEDDIPNVFVSVLLVKGRTNPPPNGSAAESGADPSDPGKPAFRLGYVELKVEDRTRRLDVSVKTDKKEYRPASDARVHLDVKDTAGRGVASEVTLWAVDYGVLSLTNYRAPDVTGSVYVAKALQVFNADSRQRIVSRRVLTPKGETDGGGGGDDGGAGTLRKDFRVLAFWVGSVTTGADGQADVNVTLPESLTTYRIMAVAADRTSRFGSGEVEVRTNKPVTLTPSFPRFMAVGDTAFFGAVVGSQLPVAGNAVVSMTSLDPGILEVAGPAEQQVTVPAGRTLEVRFTSAAHAIGRARVRMRVQIGEESDAFEDVVPVEVLASPEIVAAYGEVTAPDRDARETLRVPAGVVAGFGGLDVQVSSTALVGLGEGARYLVEYPYGCAEQKSSTAMALMLAADLGSAFSLPGIDPSRMRPVAQGTLKELERFQCASGGFAYWPGECRTVSPYLTAYVLSVMKTASDLKYDVDRGVRERAYDYLHRELAAAPPDVNEGWWPAYTAWQTFAVKVLVEGGRNEDSHITRLYGYRDRMPVFALAYLHEAMLARGERTGARIDELRRRMANAIQPEGGSAHVGELADPYLLWFWNSNVRSTAIVLRTLVNGDVTNAPLRQMVRWMMNARKDGRWGNTQENALAMEALVAYYRKYEAVVPNFRTVISLGARELAREEFRGRSANASSSSLTMPQVLAAGAAGTELPLTFTRDGEGTLYYATRLRYAANTAHADGLDSGFSIERRYEPYVQGQSASASPANRTSYAAGDLVRVTLTLRLTKERRYVAVTDPMPAGFEAVESWFATTARDLAADQDRQVNAGGDANDWRNWWRFSGFDHVERHDDRVRLFATRLAEGVHEFSYIVRATTAGMFRTAPAHAEEMYEPEVFGRTASAVIEVKR